MLNQCILVGKITTMTNDKKEITITINNPNKSEEILPVVLGDNLAKASEYLSIDTTIGVKARLHNNNGEIEILAEKITFINTKRED